MNKFTRRKFLKTSIFGLVGASVASSNAYSFSLFSKDVEKLPKTSKSLVMYFSQTGTTKHLAQEIKKQTRSDIYRVMPKTPYVGTYEELKVIDRDEQKRNYRPPLANKPDISSYDTVFVGFPTWLYTMPMVMFTLFDQVDFAGKNIVPFCTHGGTGFSDSIDHMGQLAPKSKIYEGLEVYHDDINDSPSLVKEWLEEVGFTRV